MPKVSDLTPENRFIGMFVGESGSGKTVAEASFEDHPSVDKSHPLEFLDFDGRIRGLLGATWLRKENLNYTSYPPKDPQFIQRLNSQLEGWMLAGKINQPIPSGIFADSITNLTLGLICQSIPLTHGKNQSGNDKGRSIGPIAMAGPEDFGLEAQGTYDFMNFLRSVPFPICVVSAHMVDKYGKPRDKDGNILTYEASVVVGQKLSIRDKIGVNVQTTFDHVFHFERDFVNSQERFYVTFRSDIARTSYSELPAGRFDITGKSFYKFMMSKIRGEK